MEETIDLQELFQILKKRLALIIALAILGAGASGAYTRFFITPIYQASTQLVFVPRVIDDGALQGGDINVNLQMINTLVEVIVSPMILNDVIEELGLEMSAGRMSSMINARSTSNSQVVTLTVQNERPELARDIANTVVSIFKEEVAENFHMDNVMILAPALLPGGPISPRLTMNVALGFIVGTMAGVFLAFLLEFLDKTVKSEQEIEKLIGVPVIGMIPLITAEDIVVIKRDRDRNDQNSKKRGDRK